MASLISLIVINLPEKVKSIINDEATGLTSR
jgi:hypothetical protein